MPDASTLEGLALRVEQSAGADPELDMLVWCAISGVTLTYPTEGHPMTPGRGGRIEGTDADGKWGLYGFIDPGKAQRNFTPYGGENAYPKVTASLDAAMSLVPEGWWLGTQKNRLQGGPNWSAWLESPDVDCDKFVECHASALALALTAASLRALASIAREGGSDE